jgi:endoglucanase
MNYLFIFLIIVCGLSIIITFFSLSFTKNAKEIVNDMGLGWNLGNSFDSYSLERNFKRPEDQITFWGNKLPTKKIFSNIKKYGFKTIRFPVTWFHFMDESGNVSKEWMSKVKEVVNWIIKAKMYCILNLQYDGAEKVWLSEGIRAKKKFDNLWKQISNEFKDFNEYLIFEGMNDPLGDNFDYLILLTFTQSFVDIVRNSGGKNANRLLIIPGLKKDFISTCHTDYKLPIDPFKKFAVSIHYNIPSTFTQERDDIPWTYIGENNESLIINPKTKWGGEVDYKDLFTYFEYMRFYFLDKGIPIVITESGVITEQTKDPSSIREYLFALFTMTSDYYGIMSCLWDNSNKNNHGEFNYYDRENNKWYDQQIGDNFKKIAKGNYVKISNFFSQKNYDIISNIDSNGCLTIRIGIKKSIEKVIFNVSINTTILSVVGFGVCSEDKYGNWTGLMVGGSLGKKNFDGSYTYTIDAIDQNFNNQVQIQKWWGHNLTTLNYLKLEFKENYNFFDYDEYIKRIK